MRNIILPPKPAHHLNEFFAHFDAGAVGNLRFVPLEIALSSCIIATILFLLIWLGYRMARKTRFVPYAEMEFPALPARDDGAPARGIVPAIGE